MKKVFSKLKRLSRKWFRGARKTKAAKAPSTRKLLGKRVKPIRTSSKVGSSGKVEPPYSNHEGEAGRRPPTHEQALEQLSRGSISTFGTDLQSLLSEGKDVLKSLHGDFFSEKGYEVGDASRSAFRSFYDVGGEGGSYRGLNRMEAWGLDEDAFTYSLRQRTTEIVDVLVSKDTLPPAQLKTRMDRVNAETRTLSARGMFGSLSDPYIRRPGVGLITDVIEQADREIVIDLYQLQNRTVLDALEQKVRDTPGLKVSVRLSLPDAGTREQKGFDILGPNLLSLERLRRVKESLGVGGDIELFVQDRKSHQKVMVTDKFGIIGSFNLTAPAGYDVNQAGSNYEVVRRLQTREYSEGEYRNKGLTPTPQEQVLVSSSDKLYQQLRESVGNRDALRRDPTSQLHLGQGNIVGAAETYEHLRSTLNLMKEPTKREFYGILNQVFLLYHEDTLFNEMMSGEMGKFDTPNSVRSTTMKGIQTELLDLVIADRAFIALDNRNYSEHVLTPMYRRTEEIFKGTNLPTTSLEELVGEVGFDRSNPITSFMARVGERVGSDVTSRGLNEAYTRQLLAMTSGNIKLTTVPMQHSKQYLVVESSLNDSRQTAQSFYTGSSNLGPYSTHAPEYGVDPQEVERTNREFGLAFIQGKVKEGPHALTQEELSAELELSRQSFSKDWRTLTRTAIGDVGDSRPTSAWYEDKVDKERLSELHRRLTELTSEIGAGVVSYTYGGRSGTERIALSLTLDAKQLAGFGEGFERIQGEGPSFRWDYTTLSGGLGADEGYVLDIGKGKVISRSLIHNSSASSLRVRVEDISQGLGQGVLSGRAQALGKGFVEVAPNKAAVMSPIGTTLSLVSTLLLESTNRLLVWGPEQYLSHLTEGERRALVERYLDTLTGGAPLIETAASNDRSSIDSVVGSLTNTLTGEGGGALQKASMWGASREGRYTSVLEGIKPLLSSMAYGYSMEEYIEYGLGGLTEAEARARVPVSDAELVRRRVQRAGQYIRGTGGLVDMLVPLLDSSPSFRLAVVQATVGRSNPTYREILTSGIKAMEGSLMEPFLLSAQASQYSGPQGWHRLPMFGATNEYQEVLRTLEGTPLHALASQALAIPRTFSPYSSVGIPGLHRAVASGSNSEGTSTGLTVYGQKATPYSTVMHHGVSSAMGIGFSTTREDILASDLSHESKLRALAVFDEANGDELLTYLFGGEGKVAQIPQRLKNTQGQRGMGTLSKEFSERVLSEAVAGKGDFLSYAREYGRDLRERLRVKLVGGNPMWTPNQVEQQVQRLIPEQDTVLAAAFDMSVRGVMGGEQVAIMEAYHIGLLELGLSEDDLQEGGIGHEVVRVRAIASDVMSAGLKGFTASPTYALVQMAGMYSDYFYANPLHSQLEGNLRTTTKKVKASMLGVGWTRSDGLELARAQDVVMFDPTLQKVIVINHTTGATSSHQLDQLSRRDIEGLKEAIDDRGQRSVLEAMAENVGREHGRSSISTITTTGWSRPGEDSKEYLLSMKALPGGGRNQLFYELTYVQALTPGGGRRVDSGTSLFKGVAVFLTSSYFEGVTKSRTPDKVLGDIGSKDVFGLINPSNLKSFSLEHGGSLLRAGKAEQVLAALGEREAAVAMLLAFGSNYMEGPDKAALGTSLYEALREMPGVYKETALQLGLREGPLAGTNLLTSLDKQWNPTSMYSLMDITPESVLSSLRGGTGIKDALSGILSRGKPKSSQYLNVDDPSERQAATILTALDITRQLLQDERVTPRDVAMRPDVLEQLASVVGLSSVPPDEAVAQAMVRGLSQSVASIYLRMDLSYSSSKEPLGTKGTGALQNADLVRPFTQIAKEFSSGGDLPKLRAVLANMLVSTAMTETATSLIKHVLPGEPIPIRSVLDPQLFTPLSMSKYLGIYGSGMEDITDLKKVYREYGTQVQEAIERRLTAIASGGDINVLGPELSTLLFDASSPTGEGMDSLLGTQWKPEYESSLRAIQDVGRRYELLASKPFAVGEAEAVAREMAHERGVFYLPAVVFDPMPSESGRVIARIDERAPGTSFYIPSAEDIRTYGVQYGSYTDELVRSTLLLASAFSPGTVMGNIFATLSKVKASGATDVELMPEEVKALQEYYVAAYGITERIAEASTGTRLKLEARTTGFVSTAAASLGLPQGAFLAPEEGMRGAGDTKDSTRRQRLLEVTDAIGRQGNEDRLNLLKAEREALIGGMGERGTQLLHTVYEDLEYMSRNALLASEYAAARLWTTRDEEYVSSIRSRMSDATEVEADRLLQQVRDYTRERVGLEVTPKSLPSVRSYRDMVGPRQGNEGNYYAVELGEQLLRTYLAVTSGLDMKGAPLQDIDGVSALDSNLRGRLSSALEAHKVGQWNGSIRGPVETYRIDRSLFQGLGIEESRELLADSVQRAKQSVDTLLTSLSKVDDAYGYGPEEKALVGSSRMELETLSTELSTLYATKHEWSSIDAPIARMEALQVSLNTSDVLQATVFRSAPFGSTEIQRLQFSAIKSVQHLNEYLQGQGMEQLDEVRNKSLGLLPALSAMTTTLNDFDGDPYTVIFSKMGSAMNDRQRLEDKLKANTLRIGMVQREAAASGSEYIDEYIASIDRYKEANRAISTRISGIDTDMRSLRDSLVQTYDPLLRKEVASYLGVSQAFFNEYQEGSPISMEVLPTYLQQGRGLFGGIEGVAHKNSLMAMHATMEQVHATEDFQGTLAAIKAGVSITEALSPYAVDPRGILQEVSDSRYRDLLTENPELRVDFLARMVESIQAAPDIDPSASLMQGAAALSSSEGALTSYSKYMGMGSGASMSPTVYDMLTKTLGLAGSDILGKSYNVLVGTLFRDSPLIALSHVLSSNTAMEGMREYYRGTGADVEGDVEVVHQEARRAESLQGFMKSAQQLLRDSIKFKGDTDVLGELQRAHGEYEKYLALGDESSARTVLNDMAGKLGPGPGLRSFMQLNTLVGDSHSNSLYTSPLTAVTQEGMSYLSREYKIESPESITRLTQEMRARGYVGDPLVGDVVRYKVAQDMRATITAFRYELGSKDNQPFLETVWEGMRGFLGTPDRERGIEERFKSDPTIAHDISAALTTDGTAWWSGASSKNKALMLALVDEGRRQTDPIFGQAGEGLLDFVSWEALRKKATALGSGRASTMSGGIPQGLMEADVSIALMNAAMGDKLSPEASATYMSTMMEYLGSDSKMSDVLGQTQGGHKFLDMDRTEARDRLRVIDTPGGGTRMGYADEPLLPGESYRKLMVGGQEYDTPLAYVERAVEATSTGQRAGLLKDVAKAMSEQLGQGSKLSWSDTIGNALGASLTEDEVRSATISRLQQQHLQEGVPAQEASRQAMQEARDPFHMEETRRLRGMEMREAAAPLISAALRSQSTSSKQGGFTSMRQQGVSGASHALHSKEMQSAVGRMHDMNDMVLGAGLTLLGSLMATGSINENTIGEVLGGTVTMVGYSQMGRPGVGSVLGQAFRARMAHAESKGSDDEGEWVRRWVGREVGFYMGAAVVAPAAMRGAERLLQKFSPLRLDRPMDIDKYKGWKAAANTIGGAVLSGVLGVVGSLIGTQIAVHGTNLIPSLGVVESFVRSMGDTETQRQNMIDERLAQVGEGTVMDGEGDPLSAAIEVSYVMDNPTTDFTAYPMGESDYSAGDDWEVNVVA